MKFFSKALFGLALSCAAGTIAGLVGAFVFVASTPAIITLGVGGVVLGGVIYTSQWVAETYDKANMANENIQKTNEEASDRTAHRQPMEVIPEAHNARYEEMFRRMAAEQEARDEEYKAYKRKVAVEQELQDNDILELKGRLTPPGYSQLADKHGVFSKPQPPLGSAANDETSEPGPSSGPRVRGVRRD